MTSKNAQCSTRSRFWVLKISRKIGVLKQSQPALFRSVTHLTILFEFTCVMDVRYQSIQAFVTNFYPFCNRPRKFVHWPWNIGSSNTCQEKAFQNSLRACIWQFSNRFCFFFEVVVIDAWSGYFVELLSRHVCQLTISFHTFLGMTFHILGPRRNMKIFRVWKFFSSPRGNSWFEHGSVIVHNIFAYFAFSLRTSHVYMVKEWCWFSQIKFFIECFPHWINVVFLSSQFGVIHIHRQE